MSITNNVHKVLNEISESALRVGRSPSEITLMAVSKTHTVEEIEEALAAGVLHVGENRVREASLKIPDVSGEIIWHMVGRLQSNKGKAAAGLFDWIDSVHSKKIIDIISSAASREQKTISVLVQVNISGEESKSGVTINEIKDIVLYAAKKQGIAVRGIMAIGSFGVAPDVTRGEFSQMKEIFDRLKEDSETGSFMNVLSIGMSGDYQIAVEEGSTMVRVGTAVFGNRN